MPSWKTVTKSTPCPICGRNDWCGQSRDIETGSVYSRCMRSDGGPPAAGGDWHYIKQDEHGGHVYVLRGHRESGSVVGHVGPNGATPRRDEMEADLRRLQDGIDEQRISTAAKNLGVPAASLRAIRIGWDDRQKAITFPECSGGGGVVGISRRYGHVGDDGRPGEACGEDGETKRVPKGHSRGLTIPTDFRDLPDPVVIVEGPTCTAALHALGIAAIGRPSNSGGADDLSIACRGRDVIVLGEFDPKPTGDWPGRDGARNVAIALASRWNKPVRWSMPPDRAKDARAWVRSLGPSPTPTDRERFLASIRELSREVTPAAGDVASDSERPVICNAVAEWDDAEEKYRYVCVPMTAIVAKISEESKGWPRRVAGLPFAVIGGPKDEDETFLPDEGMIRVLKEQDQLFAWLHEWSSPFWASASRQCVDRNTGTPRTAVTKAELAAQLEVSANPNYISVETLPHYPEVRGAFYLPARLPESDGTALAEFRGHLNAASEIDRDLILAALLTPGWGGPTGTRPIFLITSNSGTGVGKTKTARMISSVWGKDIGIRPEDDAAKMQSAIVSPSAIGRRIVLLDDARGTLKIPSLESALTADEFQGHRLYVGHYTVPNRKTILITTNDPHLGHDLADRAIPIYIGTEKHGSDHEEWWVNFLETRRAALVADIISLLASEPKCSIDADMQSRWKMWQTAILTRFSNGNELAELILARQKELDVEREDAEEVARVIRSAAEGCGVNPDRRQFTILKSDLCDLLIRAAVCRLKSSPQGISGWINRLRKNFDCLRPLDDHSSRRHGRRWVWIPNGSSSNDRVDLAFGQDGSGTRVATDQGDDCFGDEDGEDSLPI